MNAVVRREREWMEVPKPRVRVVHSERVKRHPARSAARVRPVGLLRAIVLFLGLAGCLYLLVCSIMGYTVLSSLNREMASVRTELRALEADRDYAAMQLEPYIEDTRIEQLARTRLNMDYPTAQQQVQIAATDSTLRPLVPFDTQPKGGVLQAIRGLFAAAFQ
uniref:FtsB family cell division protein n=1 Tax=Ndongobacter massiliensis TaxID=1871025 RepID=UPI00093052D2|nr:hypothetical protein [Ndongobacter massiliensis]